jgi:hypothetical protein
MRPITSDNRRNQMQPFRIATYRIALSRVIILTSFLVISLLAALPEVSRAQCPDSTGPSPNPDSCEWHSSSVYSEVPGTDCWDSVYFCYRNCTSTLPDTSQIWISEVVPDLTSACDSLTPLQLIENAETQVVTHLAGEGYIPADVECGYPDLDLYYVTTYVPSCWKATAKAGGGNVFSGCIQEPLCYCQTTCQICVGNNEVLTIFNCQSTSVYYCGCMNVIFPSSGWTLDECYDIVCAYEPPPSIALAKVSVAPAIDTSLQAFPNPVSGQLMITSSNAGAHFLILDVLGRAVMAGVIPGSGPISLDVSLLPSGTYYVSEGQTEVKFIKN